MGYINLYCPTRNKGKGNKGIHKRDGRLEEGGNRNACHIGVGGGNKICRKFGTHSLLEVNVENQK